ncbi:MAG: hypothetical protein ACE5ED_05915 [Rhodothalassiaceae bacterium]
MADFRDDFTGETLEVDLQDHVPSGPGSGWRRESGVATTVGVDPAPVNELRTRSKGDAVYRPQVGGVDFAPGADAQVIADWSKNSAGSDNVFLALRATDGANFIGVIFTGTGNIGVRVTKYVAGTPTILIQASGATRATAGNLIRLDAVGDTIELFYSDDNGVNWTSQGSVTETFNNTETKCGVITVNGGALNDTLIRWLEFNSLGAGGGGGVSGSGAVAAASPRASLSGTLILTGSGAMALPAAMAQAAAGLGAVGEGTAALPSPVALAVGTMRVTASGGPALSPPAAQGLGVQTVSGASNAALAPLRAFASDIRITVPARRTLTPAAESRHLSVTAAERRRVVPAQRRTLNG